MRSELRVTRWTSSLLAYLGIGLFNAYALYLHATGQLTLYIHPRYVLFTVVLCGLSLALCAAGFAATLRRAAREPAAETARLRPSFTLAVALAVLLAAYALPARTLSSETAEGRIGNFNSARAPSQEAGTLAVFETGGTPALASPDAATADLAIEDWVAAFEVEPDGGFYGGKEVDVVGFVFGPEG